MPITHETNIHHAKKAYVALRRGGDPPAKARGQLALEPGAAAELELHFQRRAAVGGGEAMRPRFARHAEHVAAVLAGGGYPVLAERGR